MALMKQLEARMPAPLPPEVEKSYDVKSNWEPFCLGCIGLTFCFPCMACCAMQELTLRLEAEEVYVTSKNICDQRNHRLPYGELAGVGIGKNCCGCYTITGLAHVPEISPGWGGEEELEEILEIVANLKARQKARGDTGQIQRSEEALQRVIRMEQKVDAIMKHLNIADPTVAPSVVEMM
mmetsp:Transcript_505/g.567  ORF Transcript_505/g.567 Transcript_505/m.567 type:complete len:180 (-) Transcript_505:116-655(-)|eukprot:CAMPEP_0197850938 /NCGR_PEP_ID=MMETSP1438-20131217/16824_1 /TAXON_ID=1461541 /ORGANISM="Pterosperma sp., Strain CCMP1384" /LENGTH=179 /DNA_ID=CAMNT_0043464363 /DNA_START=98 /DNA_END=637 /DNA_ORIENTATION=+